METKLTREEMIEEIIRLKKLCRDNLRDLRFVKLMTEVFTEHGIAAIDEPDFINLDRSNLETGEDEVIESVYNGLMECYEDGENVRRTYELWKLLNEKYENKSDEEIKAMVNGYFDRCETMDEAVITFFEELGQEVIEYMD
jgi:lipopolysaccharide biosynthesis regulator YciM